MITIISVANIYHPTQLYIFFLMMSISELAPGGNVGPGVTRSSDFSREAENLLIQKVIMLLRQQSGAPMPICDL